MKPIITKATLFLLALPVSTKLFATTGITFGLSGSDSKQIDIIAFIILPAIIYVLFFIPSYIYFNKRRKHH